MIDIKDKITNDEKINIIIGGYLGIDMCDEYNLKLYVLKEIYEYLNDLIKENNMIVDINEKFEELKKTSDRNKITSAIIVCNKLKLPIDLSIILKRKLKELGQYDNFERG